MENTDPTVASGGPSLLRIISISCLMLKILPLVPHSLSQGLLALPTLATGWVLSGMEQSKVAHSRLCGGSECLQALGVEGKDHRGVGRPPWSVLALARQSRKGTRRKRKLQRQTHFQLSKNSQDPLLSILSTRLQSH